MEAALAVAVGAQVVGAYGTYQSGKMQDQMYQMRARQALLRSDQEALREKEKGNQVLQKIVATMAAINARAGAGAIDPYSGTPQVLRDFALSEGMRDFTITRENASLIENAGILQAIDNRQAGAMARYQGRIGAIAQLGQAAFTAYSIKGSGSTGGGGGGGMPGGTAPGYTSVGPAA